MADWNKIKVVRRKEDMQVGQIKPLPYIVFQTYAVHIVVNGFFQALAQQAMVGSSGIDKTYIVSRKQTLWQWQQLNAIVLRVQSHRRVHGTGKTVKKTALDATV